MNLVSIAPEDLPACFQNKVNGSLHGECKNCPYGPDIRRQCGFSSTYVVVS